MFDLNEKIADWKQQMRAAGLKSADVLDELESHLCEEVAQQMREGASAEQAFKIAVERIGAANTLKKEFTKNGGVKRATLEKIKRGFLNFLGLRIPDPFPVLSNFPTNTRGILEQARNEAIYFHHDFIGTEHVLLGLFSEANGIVPAVLKRMGVEHQQVRMEVEKFVAPQPSHTIGMTIPYTPRARRAITLAAEEAKSLKKGNVGPEHVLLGLLREGHGVAALVLRSLGVDTAKARVEIIKELQ